MNSDSFTMVVVCLLTLIAALASLAGQWQIFKKAGEHGWAAIVPFYNMFVLYKIAFGNGWLMFLQLIPCVGFIMDIMLWYKLGKRFNKSGLFCIGLVLLTPIFVIILGFDVFAAARS